MRKGKAAIWAGTGLGKTRMQLTWADQIIKKTGGDVLILTPLAVAQQTIEEGLKIDINVANFRDDGPLHVANYEQLHNIDCSRYIGVVLDESSILKNFSGKIKETVIKSFYNTKYKLCCSATPSPNDFTEIGNHSEFLNICSRSEMLATYFVNDQKETQKWRLKGHAQKEFFKFIARWAVMISNPSDIGYSNEGYDLPPLNIKQHIVKSKKDIYSITYEIAKTLTERRHARKESIEDRCQLASEICGDSNDPWLFWCDLNNESEILTKKIDGAIEIKGTQKNELKEKLLIGFSNGDFKRLVTKPKIASMGLNWQHCNNMVFVGLSDSFEAMYQAIRRCWRFGQTKEVNVHIVITEKEGNVLRNVQQKEKKAEFMLKEMVKCMADITKTEITNTRTQCTAYKPTKKMEIPAWML